MESIIWTQQLKGHCVWALTISVWVTVYVWINKIKPDGVFGLITPFFCLQSWTKKYSSYLLNSPLQQSYSCRCASCTVYKPIVWLSNFVQFVWLTHCILSVVTLLHCVPGALASSSSSQGPLCIEGPHDGLRAV